MTSYWLLVPTLYLRRERKFWIHLNDDPSHALWFWKVNINQANRWLKLDTSYFNSFFRPRAKISFIHPVSSTYTSKLQPSFAQYVSKLFLKYLMCSSQLLLTLWCRTINKYMAHSCSHQSKHPLTKSFFFDTLVIWQ